MQTNQPNPNQQSFFKNIQKLPCSSVFEISQLLINELPLFLWSATPDGTPEFISPHWFRYTALTPSDYPFWEKGIHPDDLQKLGQFINRANITKEPYEFEYRIRNGNTGQYSWFLGHAFPQINDQGKIIRWYGCATAIDKLKKNDEEKQRRAQKIIQYQATLLELVKKDLSCYSMDKFMQEITKISATVLNIERVSIWMFNPEKTHLICKNLYILSKQKYESGAVLESALYPSYFKAINVNRIILANHAQTSPLTSEFTENYLKPFNIISMMDVPIWHKGEVLGIICHEHTDSIRTWSPEEQDFATSLADFIATDLSFEETKKIQKSLEQKTRELELSNKDLEHFTLIASHDLQEPLRTLRYYIDFMNEDCADELTEKSKKYIQKLTAIISRMQKLIEDLRSYSQIGTTATKEEAIDLKLVLKEVRNLLAPHIRDQHAHIHFKGKAPPVRGNLHQMIVLFLNLVSNSLKFRTNESELKITLSAKSIDHHFVFIRYRDNGIGFDANHHETIFQPFKKLHPVSEYEGTGMGLAICRKIVERVGGSITAKSHPGEGATFDIILPAV